MEKSHQKVLMEMRRTHKRELDQLRVEKDQLLAEETKATQAGELSHKPIDTGYLLDLSILQNDLFVKHGYSWMNALL